MTLTYTQSNEDCGPNELKTLFEDFIQEQQTCIGARPATIQGYRAAFKLFTKLNPEVDLQRVQDRSTWIGFFGELNTRERTLNNGETRQGVKNSTLLTYRSKLDVFMRWLMDTRHIKTNPLKSIRKPHVEYVDRRYMTKTELQRLYQTCKYDYSWQNDFLRWRNYMILRTFVHTGVRKSELLALKLENLNLKNATLTVESKTSKSKMRRVIPVSGELKADFNDYLRARKDHPIAWTTQALFPSSTADTALTENGLKHLVRILNEESGVHFYPHRGRHTFAANLHAKGVSLLHIQQMMGHRDPRMTLKYGRNVSTEELRSAVESFGDGDYIE